MLLQGTKPLSENDSSSLGSYRNISMVGQEVYKFAVKSVPAVRSLCWQGLKQICRASCARYRAGRRVTLAVIMP